MHQSSFDKKYQIRQPTPWRESVACRRRALTDSDSDSPTTKESLPPPPDSLLPKPPSCTPVTKKYSSCSCRKSCSSFKNHNGSNTSVQEKQNEKKSSKNLRLQQLEVKLYNAELEDATHTDKCEVMKSRMQRSSDLLEAQVLYLQSLDLKARAMERLTRLTGTLTYKDLTPTESFSQALDRISWDANVLERLSELQNAVSSVTDTPQHIYQLQDELKDKQKDYQMASNTFGQYLRCANKVSMTQLHKFESQYDSIKGKYESSRQTLHREYPKLIDERHNALQYCFSKLVPVQEKLVEQDKQFLILSKEVTKLLQEPSKKPCKHSHSDKYLQQK